MTTWFFNVQSYTVQIGMTINGELRIIDITGPVDAHGIQNHANIRFLPTVNDIGNVFNVGGIDYLGEAIRARALWNDFDAYYNLLRDQEGGLKFSYSYDEKESVPNANTRKLLAFSLLTSDAEAISRYPNDTISRTDT